MVDGSVLAHGIERLQADQNRALVLSVEKILQFVPFLIEFLKVLCCLIMDSPFSKLPNSSLTNQ